MTIASAKAAAATFFATCVAVGALTIVQTEAIADTTGLQLTTDSEHDSPSDRRAPSSAGSLSVEQVIDRLAGQGYRDVREVEREEGRYEVKARGTDDRWYELYVDAASGEVMKKEGED